MPFDKRQKNPGLTGCNTVPDDSQTTDENWLVLTFRVMDLAGAVINLAPISAASRSSAVAVDLLLKIDNAAKVSVWCTDSSQYGMMNLDGVRAAGMLLDQRDSAVIRLPFEPILKALKAADQTGQVVLTIADLPGDDWSARVQFVSEDHKSDFSLALPVELQDFDDPRMLPDSQMFSVGAWHFLDGLDRVSPAIYHNDLLPPMLCGVWVKGVRGGLCLTASDGHMLVKVDVKADVYSKFKPFKLPYDFFFTLRRYLQARKKTSINAPIVFTRYREFKSGTAGGDYIGVLPNNTDFFVTDISKEAAPDFDRVIPSHAKKKSVKADVTIRLERHVVIDALCKISRLATKDQRCAILILTRDGMLTATMRRRLKSSVAGFEMPIPVVDFEIPDGVSEIRLALNRTLLSNALKAVFGQHVSLAFDLQDPEEEGGPSLVVVPVVVAGSDSACPALALVMPMEMM